MTRFTVSTPITPTAPSIVDLLDNSGFAEDIAGHLLGLEMVAIAALAAEADRVDLAMDLARTWAESAMEFDDVSMVDTPDLLEVRDWDGSVLISFAAEN